MYQASPLASAAQVHVDTGKELRSKVPAALSRLFRHVAIALLLVAMAAPFSPGASVAAAQEYGPYHDGCFYLSEGGELTQKRCPQNDGSDYFYVPSGNQWTFAMQCSATSLFTACLFANGNYIEQYSDGSTYLETTGRQYVIGHTDGTMAEAGYYDASGMQRVYRGASTTKNSDAMRNRSLTYWTYLGWAQQTVIQSNPAAFAGLITMTQAANEYASCLHLNDSSVDFDYDSRTGFTELAEHCTMQAYG